jgi:hypothetical protein
VSDRTFSLDEAQSLLPVLESLLRAAIGGKKIMEEVEGEMQSLNHRIFLNGGTHVDVVAVARRKAERVKAEQRAKDALAEIDSIGVQVKDLDIGLLDFPCEVDGRGHIRAVRCRCVIRGSALKSEIGKRDCPRLCGDDVESDGIAGVGPYGDNHISGGSSGGHFSHDLRVRPVCH